MMKLDLMRKVCPPDRLAEAADQWHRDGLTVVLCHGCFDIVHPGHVRYLQFARQQGDVLVVSLTGDDAIEKADGTRPYVPQELRAESLAALEPVDQVVIADGPTAEPIIQALRPHVYVKGREYEHSTDPGFLAERRLVESLGGRVIYSSGEVIFSSSAMIDRLQDTADAAPAERLAACCRRWDIDAAQLRGMIGEQFAGKRVAVIGDVLTDKYVFCDASDVAGEAPILSVRPIDAASYLGGAAIIAAHLKALGAQPHLISTVAADADSEQLLARVEEMGIAHSCIAARRALPVKLRYLVETQKLLKVDQAEPQPLDSEMQRVVLGTLAELRTELDAAIISDFGYGTITLPLLAEALPMLRPHVAIIAGDVSGHRRSLLAYHHADLLTPTERELRDAVADFDQSLPTVAHQIMRKLHVANLAVTMGQRGCVLFRPREDDSSEWFNARLRSEYLPALAPHAVDPIGAGDAYLAAATLTLCAGGSLPQAGYIASLAAAITVQRIGNAPVTSSDLTACLTRRPELQPQAIARAG